REPRARLSGKVIMILIGSDDKRSKPLSVRVRDLSPRGIGLLHTKPLAADSHFAIQLPCGNNAKITVVYTVRHCKTISPDLYSIGGLLRHLPGRGVDRGNHSAAPAQPAISAA